MPDGNPFLTLPTRSLNVLYVMAAFPVLSETFVSNEIRAMRAAGHRVTPLALAPFHGPCQPQDEAFRAETLALGAQHAAGAVAAVAKHPAGLARAMAVALRQRSIGAASLLLAGARVAQAARRVGATHIHAHFAHVAAATAIVAARLADTTVSFIGHGYDVYGTPTDLAAKLDAADLAIATCDDMAVDFRRLAPTALVKVVRCGTDPDRFRRPAGMVRRNRRLLAIGRLTEQKGYPVLLSALALLPEASRPVVDAVGTGPLLDELRAQALTLGVSDSVHFLGARDSAWIAEHGPHYLGFVAPYVICANGDRDTGPMVVKEAMGMELPVVGSALMGVKEMVTPETGRLVPPGDAAALAEALAWLATLHEPERRMLGQNGRAHLLRGFTLAAQAERLGAAFAACRAR